MKIWIKSYNTVQSKFENSKYLIITEQFWIKTIYNEKINISCQYRLFNQAIIKPNIT